MFDPPFIRTSTSCNQLIYADFRQLFGQGNIGINRYLSNKKILILMAITGEASPQSTRLSLSEIPYFEAISVAFSERVCR